MSDGGMFLQDGFRSGLYGTAPEINGGVSIDDKFGLRFGISFGGEGTVIWREKLMIAQ